MIFLKKKRAVRLPLGESQIRRAAELALARTGAPPEADLTLVFTDDAGIRKFNSQFLGIDEPTDVLSFPAGFNDPDTAHPYLGDVIISVPRALAQSEENGQDVRDEIRLLVVHGVLHLLGYDHADEAEKAAMWSIQAKIIDELKP